MWIYISWIYCPFIGSPQSERYNIHHFPITLNNDDEYYNWKKKMIETSWIVDITERDGMMETVVKIPCDKNNWRTRFTHAISMLKENTYDEEEYPEEPIYEDDIYYQK